MLWPTQEIKEKVPLAHFGVSPPELIQRVSSLVDVRPLVDGRTFQGVPRFKIPSLQFPLYLVPIRGIAGIQGFLLPTCKKETPSKQTRSAVPCSPLLRAPKRRPTRKGRNLPWCSVRFSIREQLCLFLIFSFLLVSGWLEWPCCLWECMKRDSNESECCVQSRDSLARVVCSNTLADGPSKVFFLKSGDV